MARTSIKINTNQLNRALKVVESRVERVATDEIESAINQGIAFAAQGYANAVYDGSTDDIKVYAEKNGPRTWSLVAEGAAVEFIEYGTGSLNNSGYINPTTHKPYWFFKAKGRNIKLNAGGAKVTRRTYWRTTRDEYKEKLFGAIGIGGGITRIDPNSAESGRRLHKTDGKLYYTVGGTPILNPKTRTLEYRGGREVPVKVSREYVGATKVAPYKVEGAARNDDVYITKGNPPNMIMQQAHEKMAEYLYRQFNVRFK